AGQPVLEDEVIVQIDTDKVTIDVKSPAAGVLQQLLVKPSDTVVPGQLVAVVGAEAVAAAPSSAPAASAQAGAAAPAAPVASTSGRTPMISFPPRVTAAGVRLSGLPEAEYSAAVSALTAAAPPAQAPAAPSTPAPAAPAPAPPAASVPTAPMSAGLPTPSKNKLQYVTRPDGRGGPPRRPLSERELDMINQGGAY
ncbi:Dihydrolipoyllysine-residue succinyltransferase, partial [Tetrabaena socialis]